MIDKSEAFAWLRSRPDASIDLTLTDPPYSSGGAFRGDRMASTRSKYSNSDSALGDRVHSFTGDNRDQRSFILWCSLWMEEVRRCTVPGGFMVSFIDWRQLPALTDAVQIAGWIWSGVGVWEKPVGKSRPRPNAPWGACEFYVLATNGPARNDNIAYLPGIHRGHVPHDERIHLTQKPVEILRQLVQLAPPDGVVCDPFSGSGSTAVAALKEGRRFVGSEMDGAILASAVARVEREMATPDLFGESA
jgi:site-specific DNA-methyltransferase (adenine-specific)